MATGLKGKVVGGFAWNVAEKVASAAFQAFVVIYVANRLVPDDYALKAILVAFITIFNTFVDSGFSQALIRKKTVDPGDYTSAFWFNIAVSVAIYGLLVALSRPASRLFDMPEMVRYAPVFFLVVPLGALGVIQQTVLSREFDFRRISTISFAATVGGGIAGVLLARGGFGFWAIAGQRVAQAAVRAALLWVFGRWKPSGNFSVGAIRHMFGYSSRLLGTDLLNNIYNSVPNFIIKGLWGDTLGFYEQARQMRELPVTATMNAMQSVTFPALASIRDDEAKFARAVGKVVGSIVFLMFPIMAGLIVVSDEIFGVLLEPRWMPTAPFFRVLCLAGFATPIATVAANILRSRSDGRAVLRAELVKKVVATVILAATIPFGAMSIAWGVVGVAFSDAAVSFGVARRLSSYGVGSLARDVAPVAALTAVMAGVVWVVGVMLGEGTAFGLQGPGLPQWAVLLAKIGVGVGVYLGGAALLGLEAYHEFTSLVRSLAGKIRG